MPQRSGRPVGAGEAASSMLNDVFRGSPAWSRAKRVNHLWRQVARGPVRAHSCGVAIREHRVSKELVVYVDSSVWMVDFDMRKQDILQEWNVRCRGGNEDLAVSKVSFRLATRARDAGATTSISTSDEGAAAAPVPLTPEERAQVSAQVGAITDERLRRHAQNAMISVLQWKKSKR